MNQGTNYPARLPSDISVLLGRGDGTFATEIRFSAVAQPVRVAIADFNGDGKGDLAVTSETDVWDNLPGQVSTRLGRGDGTFDAGQVFTAGKGVFEVVAADIDGDDRIDIVAGHRGVYQSEFVLGDLSLFLGDGAGRFEAGRRIETGGSPIYLADADFNLDGRIDLVTANSSEDASILFGRGDGSFEAPERFGILDYPAGIAARDLNGNGRADLVAVGQDSFVVLPNQIAPPNTPPRASIAAPASVECSGSEGITVVLGGSGSFDPDSDSEDSNGIVLYQWYLDPGTPAGPPPRRRSSSPCATPYHPSCRSRRGHPFYGRPTIGSYRCALPCR